jgi:DMSO/TMAO reductase YedYZ molybdopterin-dependent catalytic subunit
VESLQPRGRYRASDVNHLHAGDADTLLALELNGGPLHIDHGYPVRLIGPNRPGVLQTKWVSRLTVT